MDKKLKSIFKKVYDDSKEDSDKAKVESLKGFEKKLFSLLQVVRETKKCDKILA